MLNTGPLTEVGKPNRVCLGRLRSIPLISKVHKKYFPNWKLETPKKFLEMFNFFDFAVKLWIILNF